MMHFSINLFGTPSDEMVKIVTRADDLGFEAVWLGEHLIRPTAFSSPYPYSPTGSADAVWPSHLPLNDPWVALNHLGALTTRIKLATGVYILPMRNPFVTARAVATTQAMSGGRAVLGVGAGWNREEFGVVREDFDGRGRRMDEIIDILRALWSGEPVARDRGSYRFDEVRFGDRVDPPIPIVVGGDSPPALRRAGRTGDGWYSTALGDLSEMVAHRVFIDRHRTEAGRDGLPFTCYVRMNGDLDAENAARYENEGFEHLTLPTNRIWRDARDVDDKVRMLDELAARLELH